MTIKKTIQTEQEIEIQIDTPAWYKVAGDTYPGDFKFYQVNSERDIIEAQLNKSYTTVNRMPMNYYHRPELIFEGEVISEQEFNQALISAFNKIAPVTEMLSTIVNAPLLVAS